MAKPEDFEQGPYFSAAIICERVLEETDGVKSAIRMIDRLTRTAVGPSPPAEMEPFDHQLHLLIRFKAGKARGPHKLEVRLTRPSGESPPPMRQTLNFEGEDDRGVDLNVDMRVKFEHPGVHWFDVLLEGRRVARLPFRVVYIPQVRQP